MEKAYDFSALASKLQNRGLDLAEEAAKLAVEEILKWVEESAEISENKFDDVIIAVLPLIKDQALEVIDHIDGEEG